MSIITILSVFNYETELIITNGCAQKAAKKHKYE